MQDLSGACFYANKHAILLVSLAIIKGDLFLAGNKRYLGGVSAGRFRASNQAFDESVVFQLFNIAQLGLRLSERRPRTELSVCVITLYIP